MQNICIGILLDLLNNDSLTADYLAEKYEISTRTVYRYVDNLCSIGVPLYTKRGKSGGISITEGFKLNATVLNDKELAHIINGLKLLDSTTSEKISDRIIQKLMSLSNSDRNMPLVLKNDILIIENCAPTLEQRNVIDLITNAISKNNVLHILYHSRNGEITERDIEPYRLVYNNGIWYVYSFCITKQAFRLFKVSRIEHIVNTKSTYEPKDISQFQKYDLSYDEPNKGTIKLAILLNESCRYSVEEWLGVDKVRKLPTPIYAYCYKATVTIDDSNELVGKLLGYGDSIKVLQPTSIINKIKNMAKNIANIYKE